MTKPPIALVLGGLAGIVLTLLGTIYGHATGAHNALATGLLLGGLGSFAAATLTGLLVIATGMEPPEADTDG